MSVMGKWNHFTFKPKAQNRNETEQMSDEEMTVFHSTDTEASKPKKLTFDGVQHLIRASSLFLTGILK